jgi:hypothetical protein
MRASPSTYRSFRILLLSALVFLLSALACLAAAPASQASAARGNKTLLLYAKNPANWTIARQGGSAKMIYHESTGAFTLTASGLSPRMAYALIRYANAPPGAEILARGTSDERGRLDLAGVWRNWTRKFWLVLGEDVVGHVGQSGKLQAWRPDQYLFEEKLIGN